MILTLCKGMLTESRPRPVEWTEDLLLKGGDSSKCVFRTTAAAVVRDVWTPQGTRDALLLFVASTGDIRKSFRFVYEWIGRLRMMREAPGGLQGTLARAREHASCTDWPVLEKDVLVFLIFVSNSTARFPVPRFLERYLQGRQGSFKGADARFRVKEEGSDSGFEVRLPGGTSVRVGLVTRLRLIELTQMALALNDATRSDLVDERFLHDITTLCGLPCLLSPPPSGLTVKNLTPTETIPIQGIDVRSWKMSLDAVEMLRLGTVLRLVTDYAYLQRLPDGDHLQGMADYIGRGGRFPTPILCLMPRTISADQGSSRILQEGQAILEPYLWQIIDGQHRCFCYYLDSGENRKIVDLNCYQVDREEHEAAVSSSLFLDVNFKILKLPIDLALTHFAHAKAWPRNRWVEKARKGPRPAGAPPSDPKLYSSRILATRFLLQLNVRSRHFKDFFRLEGVRPSTSTSVQSISTYLGPDFELRSPDDATSPLASRYGIVPGGLRYWRTRDPAPENLERMWDSLVQDLDDFVDSLLAPSPTHSAEESNAELVQMIRRNNNVFVAIWRTFLSYRYSARPGGLSGRSWPVPPSHARKPMSLLRSLGVAGKLYGPLNEFRSGGGTNRLTALLKRELRLS